MEVGAGVGTGGGNTSPDEVRSYKKRRLIISPSPPTSPIKDPETVDPKRVTGPVLEYVDDALEKSWKVNQGNSMALVFDVVNPATQFKRNEDYDSDKSEPFANYDPDHERDSDITEDDGDGTAKPYNAIPCW